MLLLRRWAGALALALMPMPALAQSGPPPSIQMSNGGYRPTQPVANYCSADSGATWVPCSSSSGGGGGGGTGDASATNQATQIAAEQAMRDRIGAVTSPAAGSTNYLLTDIRTLLGGTLAVGTHAVTQSGSPWSVSASALPLPTGAATAAAQTAMQAAPGSSAATAQGVQGVTGGLAIDTVVKSSSTDRGGVFGTTAAQLMAANTGRRGFSIQVQASTGSCYISGQATATADYHSLQIVAGAFYETPATHVGTGAISIVCSAASTSVYAREW